MLLDHILSDEIFSNIPRFDIFNPLLGSDVCRYEKVSASETRIIIAVPGFKLDDLNVTQNQRRLTITGKNGTWIPEVTKHWVLADHVDVESVNLENGLLTVQLIAVVPEKEQGRVIRIQPRALPAASEDKLLK